MKRCTGCNTEKDIESFSPNGKTRKGTQKYRSQCKECESSRQDSIRASTPNTSRYSKSRRKGYQLKRSFGMTYDEWVSLMDSRGWACEICSRTVETSGRTLAVDHDHTSGEIRGVLCQRCNCAIGLLSENPEHIANAINYLKGGDYGSIHSTEC